MLPADDLYARLELPADASFEAVEVAWRALLKQHHPDVAGGGADADDRAKRINVAHDWLSDPDLRARYDRERHDRRRGPAATDTARPDAARDGAWRRRRTGRAASRSRPAAAPVPAGRRGGGPCPPSRPVERLTPDEIDRLCLAETPADRLRRLDRPLPAAGAARPPRVRRAAGPRAAAPGGPLEPRRP